MDFLTDLSGGDKVLLFGAIWGVVQTVVRLTPTKKDDEITSKVGAFLNFFFNKTATKR